MPEISPDGKWLAYLEGPTPGSMRIYVQPFPELDATHQVPDAPGGEKGPPTWSPAGDALYYVTPAGVFAVEVKTEPRFSLSRPRLLIAGSFDHWTGATPVGDRFLVAVPVEQEPVTELHVVVDWFAELERLVPTE